MIVLRRLWVADGFGPMAAMKVSSSSSFFIFLFFCVVLLGFNWAPILRGRHKTTCYQIFDSILGLDLVLGFWVLIWWGWVLI